MPTTATIEREVEKSKVKENENIRDVLAREAEDVEARRDRGETGGPLHRVRPPRDPAQVYSLRMPVDRLEQLRRAAEDAGVSPSALMRTWVLERLDNEDQLLAELRRVIRDEVSRQISRGGRPQSRRRAAVG